MKFIHALLLVLPLAAQAQSWQATPRNGAPSPAAQMQSASSAAYLERARTLNQPSPAARLQQQPAQPGLLPGFTPYHAVPESQRQAIVQQHYAGFPDQAMVHPHDHWHRKARP